MHIHPALSAKLSCTRVQTLPVILYCSKTIPEVRTSIAESYGKIKYELPFINAVSVDIPRQTISELAKSNTVRLITDDALVSKAPVSGNNVLHSFSHHAASSPNLDEYETKKVPSAYYARRGKGVGIAIIDTGVAPHYDLIKPVNRICAFKDFINGKNEPYDDDGHGTHVAGVALGGGYSSWEHVGAAPWSDLIAVKALDGSGNGITSNILAAIQWVINHKKRYNIRVINLSLGIIAEDIYDEDPLVKGADAAARYGLTVVAAAGNNGPDQGTINSPGTSPNVITVGAADLTSRDEEGSYSVARFSSRGPTAEGLTKPDLLAPGVDIWSLDAEDPGGYMTQSGTSMAAPAVSGAAACLYSQNPKLDPVQVKSMLTKTALPLKEESRFAQGRGLLNHQIFIDY